MKKIIGTITKYLGSDYGMKGYNVKIISVLHRANDPDYDIDSDDFLLQSDREIEQAGGVTSFDRVDVQPIHADGRQSFVHCDPLAIELECFKSLRNKKSKKVGSR